MKAGVGEHRTALPNRTVALHADDFGMNGAVNAGIAGGFRRGLLTGTSLLVNGPAAESAAEIWSNLERERQLGSLPSNAARLRLREPDRPFDLGLHLNLTQGKPLTDGYPNELRNADGTFCGVWRLASVSFRSGTRHRKAIGREIGEQLARGRDLGLTFVRVDGHQYVEMLPMVADVLGEQLSHHGIKHVRTASEPHLGRTTLGEGRVAAWLLALVKRRFAERYVRRMRGQGFAGTDLFFGTAHAGRITSGKLRQFLGAIGDGETAEIGLHPAEAIPTGGRPGDPWFDPLAERRPQELALLVGPDLADDLAKRNVRLGRVAGGSP
jgi:chitin disaccharide deacetylase